jgi:hypothetical protein
MDWIHVVQDRDQWWAREHGNELSGSITFCEMLELLCN